MTEPMFKPVVADPVDTPPGRVYLDHFQLIEAPFAITPDPGFLFSSRCHRQVLDKIGYAIDGRMGFVLLTGEVGTGKTTLCRTLLDGLNDRAETVYLINPSVSGQELLASILEDLGATPPPRSTKKALIDQLNQWLLARADDRPLVVIIDDAQTMTPETLEDLRLLSNLETDKRKLIQVVLTGQPELLDLLADDRLRQLKQRIAVYCRLEPLSARETGEYISRRLFVAGNKGQVHFSTAATRRIHKIAGGIPRLINKICDFALTAGYVNDAPTIGPAHVKRALAELGDLAFRGSHRTGRGWGYGFPAAMMVILVTAALFILQPGNLLLEAATKHLPVAMGSLGEAPPAPAEKGPDNGRAMASAERPGAPTETGRRQPDRQPAAAPYALQLGSFRSAEDAQRGTAQYREKGVSAHWQMVADGRWYRIVAGKFENPEQAARFQRAHGLSTAIIIKAPLTLNVLSRQKDLPDTEIRRFLSEIGFDSRMETSLAGDDEIHTGLFLSAADATNAAERINAGGRLLAQVVSR